MTRAQASGPVALEVEGVDFAYPRRPVLEDVSFSVPEGRFCVLLGLNGAGKTTLFSLITRLFLSRSGSIRIFGNDVRKHGRRALSYLGVVFQQPTLDLDLTVRQNLRYYCALHGLPQRPMRAKIQETLQNIGLEERADDKVRQLSGGQRRRLELARAFLHRPRLLLADEPTVGLDIHSRQSILRQVRESCDRDRIGVLWATHLVDEVRPDDAVVVIHQGCVRAQGTASQIMAETASESVHQAFSSLTGGAQV
ncbi:MAG: ABC transporter ATP-binding protein [Chromatiaceae bacterium]